VIGKPETDDHSEEADRSGIVRTTSSYWVYGASGNGPLKPVQSLAIFLACVIPNFLVVAILSDVGYGVEVYNAVSPRTMSLGGDVAVFLAAVSLVVLYVSDWFYYERVTIQVVTAIPPLCLITLGAFLKARNYPWAPMLFTLFSTPVVIGFLRAVTCTQTKRETFYRRVSMFLGLSASVVLVVWIVWMTSGHQWNRTNKDELAQRFSELYKYVDKDMQLNYTQHCHPDLKNISHFPTDVRASIKSACSRAASVWLLVYAAPFVAVLCDVVVGVFCFTMGVATDTSEGDARLNAVVRAMKQFIICLFLLFGGMYCSASIFSISLTTTLLAFLAAALLVLVIWMVLEMPTKDLQKLLQSSSFAKLLGKAWQSDWVRAIAVGAVNFFIPIYFFLNSLNQKVRKARKPHEAGSGRYTPQAQKILDEIHAWNWCSILTKVAIFGELFFTLQVGFTKGTYVFLSWLTRKLASINLIVVCVLVYAVGLIMFLLPPVPGVPVYIFAGIVIADVSSRKLGDNGFYIGIFIACCIGFFCKLLACTLQYYIGYFLGKNVKIQQLIKVDSVPTRAVEQILKKPGLNLAKVAILIGGPDWPVSVTCGILRLNIPQMLLGTMPVITILSPCVLAGAFISRQGLGGEDSIWPMLANFASIFAFVAQTTALVIAGTLTVREIQEHSDSLAEYREEHAAIAELSRQEEDARRCYQDVTRWENLTWLDGFILLSGVASQLVSGLLFVLVGSLCFLPFSVDKDINAAIEDGGLGGHPLNIVLPLGWAGCLIFFYGVAAHIVHSKMMGRRAKAEFSKRKYSQQPETEQG